MQRKKYSAAFKAKVALELAKEHQTINEVATKYSVHPDMISKWKKQLLENLPGIFSKNGQKGGQDNEKLITSLYQKIGQLEVEIDWLKKKSEQLR